MAQAWAALRQFEEAAKILGIDLKVSRACSTCKHWVPNFTLKASAVEGECKRMLYDKVSVIGCNRDQCIPELETSHDFGCNLWEGKGEWPAVSG